MHLLFHLRLVLLLQISVFISLTHSLKLTAPLNCSDQSRLCTSFIAFKPNLTLTSGEHTASLVQSMFDASPSDLYADPTSNPGYFFIKKNCSCLTYRKYLTNTTFTVPPNQSGVPVAGLVSASYNGLALSPNMTRLAMAGAVVSLHLFCGCSSGLWNYLLSYVLEEGDSVVSLSSRFGASMDSIEAVNGLTGPDGVVPGTVLYIPLNSVPGLPYSAPSPSPSPAPTYNTFEETQEQGSRKFPYTWVVGSMGVALVIIIISILILFLYKYLKKHLQVSRNRRKAPAQPVLPKFQLLKSSSFLYGSGRYFCCQFGVLKQPKADAGNQHVEIPNGMVAEAFDREKPIVFSYNEILISTDSFSDPNLLGHGTYGSVYYGVLRDQEVAIKRMKATKTREFIAEMKVLCKVHHASLVELIGYAASSEELFLVYEYAQKGSLKNHLHDPQNKGQTSLSWILRVQIALDAARGLEYIHEHTRDHYVHRDIKTSNILLDTAFRAKISDFGLSKLVLNSSEEEASVTKVVGTFGYLAPEYLRDGFATSKSDVYAFGVVLFELITGKEAITRTMNNGNSERRSLASVMLNAMRNVPDSTNMDSLKRCIDPNLMDLYPHDCVFKLAMLAKQCVEEDPILRPDAKQVVISLSQILLSSVEWEAGLAGNSQIFSGLVQGR